MKLKYPPCKNCGASKYEINSLNTYKCEFCGTEYEIESGKALMPKNASWVRNDSEKVFVYDHKYNPIGIMSIGEFKQRYPEQAYKLYL